MVPELMFIRFGDKKKRLAVPTITTGDHVVFQTQYFYLKNGRKLV